MLSFGVYDIGDYGDTIDDLRVNQEDNDLNYIVSSVQSVRFYSSGGSSYSGYVIEVSSIETIDDMDNYVNTLSRSNNIIYSDFEDDLISSDNTININGEYRSGLTRLGSGNGGVLNSVYTGCVGVGTPHIILIDQRVLADIFMSVVAHSRCVSVGISHINVINNVIYKQRNNVSLKNDDRRKKIVSKLIEKESPEDSDKNTKSKLEIKLFSKLKDTQKVFVPNSKSIDDFSNDKIYDNKSKGSSTNNECVHHDESDIETVIALAFGRSIDLNCERCSTPLTNINTKNFYQNVLGRGYGMIIPF